MCVLNVNVYIYVCLYLHIYTHMDIYSCHSTEDYYKMKSKYNHSSNHNNNNHNTNANNSNTVNQTKFHGYSLFEGCGNDTDDTLVVNHENQYQCCYNHNKALVAVRRLRIINIVISMYMYMIVGCWLLCVGCCVYMAISVYIYSMQIKLFIMYSNICVSIYIHITHYIYTHITHYIYTLCRLFSRAISSRSDTRHTTHKPCIPNTQNAI